MFEYPKISKQEIQPGMFRIDHEDYHEGIGVSSSTLKKVLISPAHSLVEEKDKPHFAFGRSLHMRLIEPELWEQCNIVLPNVYRRSKAEKRYWELIEEAKAGPVEMSGNDCLAVLEAVKDDDVSVRMNALISDGLKGKEIISDKEQTIMDCMAAVVHNSTPWKTEFHSYDGETAGFWMDDETGLLMKCKADLLGGDTIVDLKSTAQSAKPEIFIKEAIQRQYHVSAAYYEEIFFLLTGRHYDFIWAAIEKPKEPEDLIGVSYVRCPPELLEAGRNIWKKAFAIYAECVKTGEWPCYPDYVVDVAAPAWALR